MNPPWLCATKHLSLATEIEITEIQSAVGGSNGTIGALLKLVKLEHLNAKELDRPEVTILNNQLHEKIEEINRDRINELKRIKKGGAAGKSEKVDEGM